MGFNPPVPQQDNNWEIRVAVLLSLLLQVFLIFLGPVRKRSVFPWVKPYVWAFYLLADWVADLALGLILNNMGNIGGGGNSTSSISFGLKRGGGATAAADGGSGSPIIFAFWTPFLLLHLGGPDTITAYSLEDNDLWQRHLIGLLFELFSALVIFFCSRRSNPLIHATVLMFVAGIIKYGERTYCMYCGSVQVFRANLLGPPDRGPAELEARVAHAGRLESEVEIAVPNAQVASPRISKQHEYKSIEAEAYELFLIFRRLFVDLIFSVEERRLSKALFLSRVRQQGDEVGYSEAMEVIEMELDFVYDALYTKAPVAYTKTGWVLRAVCSGCLVSTLLIFLRLDKARHGISRVDAGITYALLLGGLALDVVGLAMLSVSDRAAAFLSESQRRPFKWLRWLTQAVRWPTRRRSQILGRLNLIECSLHSYYWWSWLWELVQGDRRSFRYVPLTKHLLEAIFASVKEATKAEAGDDYLDGRQCRGERAIGRHKEAIRKHAPDGAGEETFGLILDSVKKRDFDESLLMWHIATELCLELDPPGLIDVEKTTKGTGVALSEYMLYLLVMQSEMVSAKTGIWLMRYRDTFAEARRFFDSQLAENKVERRLWHGNTWQMLLAELGFFYKMYMPHRTRATHWLRQWLLRVNTSGPTPPEVNDGRSKSVLFDACILAKALRELDDELRWEVVMGVWLEILTFTAANCGGTTHIRHLNRGGELITIVRFLMENMGLGDTYHTEQKRATAGPSSSSNID